VAGSKHSPRSAFLVAAWLAFAGAIPPVTGLEAQILDAHNAERLALGLPPLKWNAALAHGARQWSDHLAATGRFEHSPNGSVQLLLGENIWGGTPGAFRPQRMVAAWIAEKQFYRPGIFPSNSTTGNVQDVSHYTQVIWRTTQEVGCGLSRSENEEILVCRYSAPGNVIGFSPI
jgi:hypothetical protein